ncbi:hypothetical protein F5X96DRAFT_630121 [Biscogniauxia mediterranea]|nr:hypothetical protein F5X96DRAFT_630121 [Biscogniauxia mediterranea]
MQLLSTPSSILFILPLLTSTTQARPFEPESSSSFTPRMEISDSYKQTLSNPGCSDIRLEDGVVLKALCAATNPAAKESSLDLNTCFANYGGSLTRVTNGQGGFAGSCTSCQLSGTKLACECSTGAGGRLKHNDVELDDWDVVQVNDAGGLQCASTFGLS